MGVRAPLRWLSLAGVLGLGVASSTWAGEEARLEITWPRSEEIVEPGPIAGVEGRTLDATPLRVTWTTPTSTETVDVGPRETVLRLRPRGPAQSDAWLAALERRLRASALGPVEARGTGDLGATVRVPHVGEPLLLRALARLRGDPSDLQFRVEVLPREWYPHLRDGNEAPPRLAPTSPRTAWPWPGTEEEFLAWKHAEIQRWFAAQDAFVPYEPSRPGLRLVPVLGPTGDAARAAPDAFRVVEEGAAARSLDARILENPIAWEDLQTLRPAVLFAVRPAYQAAFRAFTEENLYLPLALLHRGRYLQAPVIQSPLEDRVQVSLGSGDHDRLEEEARLLAELLDVGAEDALADPVLLVRRGRSGTVWVTAPAPRTAVASVSIATWDDATSSWEPVVRTVRAGVPSDDSAEAWVRRFLAATHWGERDAGERALRRLAGTEGQAALLAHLSRSDAGPDRRVLLEALAGAPGAADRWQGALTDPDPTIRHAAIEALASDGARADVVVEAVIRVLAERSPSSSDPGFARALKTFVPRERDRLAARRKDPDPAVRRAVAWAMRHAGSLEGARGVLAESLRDADPGVREVAVDSVGALTSPLGGARGAKDRSPPPEILSALADLVREDPATRRTAAQVLADAGEEGARAVGALLADPSAVVRTTALGVLASSGLARTDEQASAIAPLLQDPNVEVRLAAALALLRHEGSSAATLLALEPIARQGTSLDARVAALLLLAASADGGGAERVLEDLASDPDPVVSGAAVLGLAARHPDDAALGQRAGVLRREALPPALQGFEEVLRTLRAERGSSPR